MLELADSKEPITISEELKVNEGNIENNEKCSGTHVFLDNLNLVDVDDESQKPITDVSKSPDMVQPSIVAKFITKIKKEITTIPAVQQVSFFLNNFLY